MKTTLFLLFSLAALSVAAQPANDNCASATVLTVNGACTSGTNVAATTQLGETGQGCWGTATSNTVWYRFTTGAAGVYNVGTDNGGTTDTQIKIISGSCAVQTTVACSEDNGSANTFAAIASANLAAATTYFVQVDVYGATTGTFCINVAQANPPANDCVLAATDITAQINGITTSNLFDCATYTYNLPGPGGEPTRDDLAGDANQCNGADILTAPIPDHRDIWFTFTVDGSTPPAWLSVYQQTGTTPSYSAALYSGTPAGSCGAGGSITGLTYIDCSTGDFIEVLPTDNTQGSTRDMGVCTTPLHPRIDISSLAPGTYYFRVWETFGGAPTDGIINLCAEHAVPAGITSDPCPTQNTVGCDGLIANSNVSASYSNLANNACLGNACNTAVLEPQLAAGAAGQIRDGCAGPWVTQVGYANNVMNNSAIYQFTVNASAPCNANVVLEFKDIDYGGTEGNVAQIQVMNGTCVGGVSAIMTGVTNQPCLEMRPVGGTLPNGQYYIVVDGQDGQLVGYDLNLSINYSGIGCSSVDCGSILLSVEFDNFDAIKLEGGEVLLSWETLSEKSNDYFVVQRTEDGFYYEDLGIVDGSGNASELNHYEYRDISFRKNSSYAYYRIKQVDLDGEVSYSNIRYVQLSEEGKQLVRRINLMGQEVNETQGGLVIEVYSDGTSMKKFLR
ncbi:MAG: hypothetical protein K0R65_3000 [Crocinitomicaceae bacterium]|jgi:hypothetical protein|nr:hypothetical protein [Crocinitomicaceae bacterium]